MLSRPNCEGKNKPVELLGSVRHDTRVRVAYYSTLARRKIGCESGVIDSHAWSRYLLDGFFVGVPLIAEQRVSFDIMFTKIFQHRTGAAVVAASRAARVHRTRPTKPRARGIRTV